MFITFARQNKNIDDWKYVNYVYCYILWAAKPFQTFPEVPDDACSAHLLTNRTQGIYYITLIDVFG